MFASALFGFFAASSAAATVPNQSAVVSDLKISGVANASIAFGSDGSISYPTGNNNSGPSTWCNPPAGGASLYVKFVLDSGSAWNFGLAAGTVYTMGGTRQLAWSANPGSIGKSAAVRALFYSDSGGSNLLGTVSISVDLETS